MVIEESILINADLGKVWETFTNLTYWEDWNTVMKNVCSDKKCITPGSELRCSFHPFFFPVKAEIKVEEVIPDSSFLKRS